MNDEGSKSKLSVVSSEKDLGSDCTLQCDKTFAKTMQSLGLIKKTFTHLNKESFLILNKAYIATFVHT